MRFDPRVRGSWAGGPGGDGTPLSPGAAEICRVKVAPAIVAEMAEPGRGHNLRLEVSAVPESKLDEAYAIEAICAMPGSPLTPVSPANKRVSDSPSSWDVAKRSLRGEMPGPYRTKLNHTFQSMIRDALRPGMTVLDIGSGRHPSIPPAERPADSYYIGLDVSARELELAPPGSYDEVVVADVTSPADSLLGRVDLAISFQVFEHVSSLQRSFDNVHEFLRPGGRLIAQFSGRRTLFGLANRFIPHSAAKAVLRVTLRKRPDQIFPTYYDRCWYDAVVTDLSGWTELTVTPLHRGATYLGFSRRLRAAYLLYEEWVRRSERHNLAAYYIVDATR
ncbi:MAG: hypothetical protein QOF30_2872 [Acidimicrobiaceae bacterium]|nr:hypothetical protein [Acidimicrobiaceae bacterium]